MKLKSGFLKYILAALAVAIGIETTWLRMVSGADENKTTLNVNIGIVLDLKSLIGKIGLSCIDMSLSDFYASHPNHTTIIVLHIKDSRADVVEAATQAMELIQKSKVEAILGPESSSQAYFIIKMGEKAEIPIVSFAPTISSLSYLNSPYFFRVAQNDSSQVYAISDIIKAYGWKEVVVIYQNDEFEKWILTDLIDALQTIRLHRSVIHPLASDDEIREELRRLSMMQTRIFIIHMVHTLASRVFIMANEMGLMNQGCAWIVTDPTTNALNHLNSSTLNSMQGVLGVKTYVPRTMELHNFKTRWREKFRLENPTMDNNPQPQVDVYGLWAYDVAVERNFRGWRKFGREN